MHTRLIVLVVAAMSVVGFARPAAAQSASKTLTGVTCPGDGCLETEISSTGEIAVQVTGTFNGTIVFERTVDGVTWAPWALTSLTGATVSLTTTTGLWTGQTEGSAEYRIRFSTYWSGSASATYNFVQSGSGNFSARYLLAQEDASLPNAQVLGDVAEGLLKNVVTPGVNPIGTLTPAVAGVDYVAPNGSGTGLSGVGLLANPLSQFAPTTSAQLLALLTNPTGTGQAVFHNQPTIVAPTIGRIANLTTNGVIVTTNGDGTLAIGSALPACANNESPIYIVDAWVCATLVNTATAYNDPSWVNTLAWSKITGEPTTVAGYGITDGVATGGSYADPSWITSLAWSKITGTPTTVAGYGIADAVATGGSYSNPSWLTALAWSKVTGTPTTYSGYGITDIFAKGTITASDPFVFTQTWNNAAVSFSGFEFNVTNTASNASSTTSSFIHVKEGANTVFRIMAGADGGNGRKMFLGANSIRMGHYLNPYSDDIYIGSDVSIGTGLRFSAPSHEYLFGSFGNVKLWVGQGGGQGGLEWTSSTGALCLKSNGSCRLRHNTTTNAWEPTIPVSAPKVSGLTTSAPSISGNATLVANSTDVQGAITSTVTGAGSAVLTFSAAYTTKPSCIANNETAGTYVNAVATTTTATLSGTWTTSDNIVYICIGR